MLIVVTVLFAICLLPNNVIWLWLDFGDGEDYRYFWDMVAVSNLISLSFSQIEPQSLTRLLTQYAMRTLETNSSATLLAPVKLQSQTKRELLN